VGAEQLDFGFDAAGGGDLWRRVRQPLGLPSAFLSEFPELRDSDVPALLDAEMVALFREAVLLERTS